MRTHAPRRFLLAMLSCLFLIGTLVAQTAHVDSTDSSQKVSIDPKTRKIVPPNPEDSQALSQKTQRTTAAVPAKVQVRNLPSGGRVAQLPEEYMDAAVVSLNEDGTLNMECVRGMDAADKLVESKQTSSTKPSTQAAKTSAKPEQKE